LKTHNAELVVKLGHNFFIVSKY